MLPYVCTQTNLPLGRCVFVYFGEVYRHQDGENGCRAEKVNNSHGSILLFVLSENNICRTSAGEESNTADGVEQHPVDVFGHDARQEHASENQLGYVEQEVACLFLYVHILKFMHTKV